MLPASFASLLQSAVTVNSQSVVVLDEPTVRHSIIDKLIYQAVFGDSAVKPAARWLIWEIAQELGIYPSSIHPLYQARGRRVIPADFTVPAMNFRGLAYDTSRALFKTAVSTQAKAFICELSRGEMIYTDQSPAEFALAMLAGAIREDYVGPVFIQGDHFQTKASLKPAEPDPGEIEALVNLIQTSLESGFYNLDIDTSTLVDLNQPQIKDQQQANIHYTAELLQVIRSLEPAGLTVSIGGEIGHIGGKNSTLADFTTYMDGLIAKCSDLALISKISVATGTSHGGVVNPDGTIAPVDLDFNVLRDITAVAMDQYHLAGAVQHGASTLPDDQLSRFPDTQAVEIHLATGFQNALMDHPDFPQDLLASMYSWLDQTKQAEREPGSTDEQFHYKLRKKCWGQFKQPLWDLPESTRQTFRDMLSARFDFIFRQLHVENTAAIVDQFTPINPIHKEISDFALAPKANEVIGLAD